ncbi:MAG: hypothetical protein GWO84_06885 [Euryarchaeota archaeon]|nr:hypothetical protein [Euryarchaeota archaeon]
MSRKQVNMEPASSKKNQYQGGAGLERPPRRTLEGHTSPCEECFAVDWNMDVNRGEIVCNSCGLVAAENVIDPGAEWINGDSGQDKSRVGAPLT